MTELHALSPEDKVAKAIEFGEQGLTRQEIADILYSSPDKKNRLGGLRKLMGRKGYTWSDEQGCYIVSQQTLTNTNKQNLTLKENNKQQQTATNNNKQDVTTTVVTKHKQTTTNSKDMKPVSLVPEDKASTSILTEDDMFVLKELVTYLKTQPEALQGLLGGSKVIGTAELLPEATALEFTSFKGSLQSSTLQLHSEVWQLLNSFCEKRKVSKKVVVNEAIWAFLQQWGDK